MIENDKFHISGHFIQLYPIRVVHCTRTSQSACNLYLQCESFLSELAVLATFTEQVTLPFLICLESDSSMATLL